MGTQGPPHTHDQGRVLCGVCGRCVYGARLHVERRQPLFLSGCHVMWLTIPTGCTQPCCPSFPIACCIQQRHDACFLTRHECAHSLCLVLGGAAIFQTCNAHSWLSWHVVQDFQLASHVPDAMSGLRLDHRTFFMLEWRNGKRSSLLHRSLST